MLGRCRSLALAAGRRAQQSRRVCTRELASPRGSRAPLLRPACAKAAVAETTSVTRALQSAVRSPPTQGRAGEHTAEFFYHPERDGEVLQAASDPFGTRLRSVLLTFCTGAIAIYVGVYAAPIVGQGSAVHATRLLRAREPFLQKSGADRLALLLRSSDALAQSALQAGAPGKLLALLDSPDATVVAAAAAALAALAGSAAGAEALRAEPQLMALQALASEQTGEQIAGQHARAALRACGLMTAFGG